MRLSPLVGGLVGAWMVIGVASAQVQPVGATAEVRDAAGRVIATVEFRDGRDELFLTLRFATAEMLTGTRAMHIMERGRCDPPSFASAGGIFNPLGKQHGLLNPAGPMAGDLPDLVLGSTGLAAYNSSAPFATLRPGPASILNPNGSALVIFAGQDDNLSQPDGNVGQRIACGVILAPGQSAPRAASDGPPWGPLSLGVAGAVLAVAGFVVRRVRSA